MICKHAFLNPYSPDTSREIIFSQMKFISPNIFFDESDDIRFILKELDLHVSIMNKSGTWSAIYGCKLRVIDYGEITNDRWWITGLVHDDDYDFYNQEIVDFFSIWENNKKIDWFSFSRSNKKRAYIMSCYLYSRLSISIVKKYFYEIDLALIKETIDFFYLAGLTFIGERGYFGSDLYTFEDCLLIVYRNKSLDAGLKIVFLNRQKLINQMVESYQLLKDILLRFNFSIEER